MERGARNNPIRILIADDHEFYRAGVRAMLDTMPQTHVAGEADSGDRAVAQALALQPDVILMDIQMPGLNGIEATRRIVQQLPDVAIVMLTMFDEDDSVFAAMRSGARGYLLKDARLDDLVRAVTAASRGEAIFGPAIARRMMHLFGQAAPAQVFPELTDREREVLALVAQGLSNEEIAARLVLSVKTVRNHVSAILGKIQARDRAEAVARARDAGLR